jgi:hypothetical protein
MQYCGMNNLHFEVVLFAVCWWIETIKFLPLTHEIYTHILEHPLRIFQGHQTIQNSYAEKHNKDKFWKL